MGRCLAMQGMFRTSHMQTRFVVLSGSVPLQRWPRMEIKPLSVSEAGSLPSTPFTAGLLPKLLAAAWGSAAASSQPTQ